ncbi:MAG: hypothetical protein WC491_08530 [Candidatus Omnitrophota bacterium]
MADASKLIMTEGDAAETPAAGTLVIYAKSDSIFYYKDDAGVERGLTEGMANPMTTAGDIVYGGVDGEATRLAKGTAGQVLTMNSGATAPEWGKKAQPGGVKSLTDGATIAIDWDNGATQYVVLGATGRTVTFANPREGEVYRFIIIQDGTGSRTITTWPTIKWAGGSAPTLTTTGGKADVVTLLYANSSYYGDCSKVF